MFFNCHNHTMYSNLRLLDCIIKPKDLIDRAIELGLSGIAITDHEALSAHMEVNMYAKKIREKHPDFTIALGNEIYLTDTREKGQPYYHFILIAKDAIGHKGLRELSSKAWYNSYFDRGMERVPLLKSELEEIMTRYKGHIMGTTACMGGELSKLIVEYQILKEMNQPNQEVFYKMQDFIQFCIRVFGPDDFYIECAPSTMKDQIMVNRCLGEMAQLYGLNLVPATDSHYLSPETRFAHKAYLNSKGGDREVDSFYEFARLMDEKEVRELLLHSFEETTVDMMMHMTEDMRQKIEWYSLERPQQIPVVDIPKREHGFLGWAIPSTYPTLDYINKEGNVQEQYWLDCCFNALRDKGLVDDVYFERLEIEADVIRYIGDRLGTCLFAYFNTFKHYIDLFWECGSIVGPGRGSATGFLSNYLLGITQLNPIKWNLPWWRFLNKERAELPDIDIDLAPSKRAEIFQRIREERGEMGLIQVITFGTEGSKSAILTACRGYRMLDEDGIEMFPDGIDVDVAQYIASLIPSHRGFLWSIKDVVYGNKDEDRQPIAAFKREVDKYPGLLDIIFAIEGIVKQRGCHASGVIMYEEDKIYDTAAIMRTPSGDLVTCYDLHMAEAAGDTKYDFLVTEVSDKIIKALELMQEDEVIDPDMSLRQMYEEFLHPEHIDTTDPEIWEALAEGSVLDVFQFSGGVGLAIAKKLKPQNPLEMTAANAMMRLMSEKGVESQQDRYARIQKDGIAVFDYEMRQRHMPDEIIQKRIAIESIEGCYFRVGEADDSSVSFNSKWTVYVPSHIRSVAASNSFGNITVGKGFSGLIRIDVKNGDVNIPETKAMCVVEVTHGNFYVGNAVYLNMTTKHANGTIAFAQTLKVQAEHADFYKIDKADIMTINSKHSKIKVGNVGQLSSQGSYSTLEVNELSGLANIRDMQHSTIEMGEFLGKLDATDLSYSKLNITISKYNHTPVIMVTDLDYTDVKVKLPASLRTSTYVNGKGSCKSTSSGTAKIKSSAPWSSPNGISTHVFKNTESFTPNSLIDINNESYGTILIEEY